VPGLTGAPKAGFFYPRLMYLDASDLLVTVDFEDPVNVIEGPWEERIEGRRVAESGVMESLLVRIDRFVRLTWAWLDSPAVQKLRTVFRDIGGRQVRLILDRFGTTAGQYEADVYNYTFARAELQDLRFVPARTTLGLARYTVSATFRQGTKTRLRFLPSDLTGLVGWWRAESLLLNDGASVSTWSDESGQANHLSQATGTKQPTYRTNVLNGKPAIRFDGVNDLLTRASSPIGGVSAWSIFFVGANPTVGASRRALNPRGAASVSNITLEGSSNQPWALWRNNAALRNFNVAAPSILTVIRVDGTSESGWGNGTLAFTGTPDVAAAGGMVVGAEADGVNHGAFDLLELILYSRATTDTERRKVESYLGFEYGLPV
jgi:hypothetical protein